MSLVSALASNNVRVHFDDESWHGGGFAFLAESAFCMVSILLP
jgi:hypothetical protein